MDERLPEVSDNAGHESYLSRRRPPHGSRFAVLPPFRLVYTIVLSSLLLPGFLIFVYSWGWDRRSVGIQVSVLKQGSTADYSAMPALVRIEDAGADVPPRLYINSKPVLLGELASALKNQLELGPDWVVYVEADGHTSWADTVSVVDIIRGTNAEIVLLTTNTTKASQR
jgi:biopolymer transport protein ExbD